MTEEVVETVQEVVETPAESVQAKTEQEPTHEGRTEEQPTPEGKITTPPKKDPKKVEAGRLSAISRAAKKRQREQLGVEEEKKTYPYWNPSSILYFGVPSIFLLGMFFWTIKDKKTELVVEYTPAEKVDTKGRLPDEKKKKRETVSLFE